MGDILRNTGSFRVQDGHLLLYRVGPANGRVQHHNASPLDFTGKPREWDVAERGSYASYTHRAPERHGFWAFPHPFQDAFFYAHVWERHMPKRLSKGALDTETATDEECEAHWQQVEKKLRLVRRMLRPKLIWQRGPFYSHIRPKGVVGERNWWRYECARDFVEAARSELWAWQRWGTEVYRVKYCVDQLEIFVPT